MHQLPRGSRKSLLPAPAASDQLGQVGSGGKTQSSDVTDELEAGRERASSVEDPGTDAKSPRGRIMAGHSSEAMSKLNQIIQNYFIKAALIVVQSRMACPPSYNKGTGVKRVNKWFNVEIEETDIFREDWRPWKSCDTDANRPPPMIVETYLDMAALTRSQTLVVIDDQGKRWNVDAALNASGSPGPGRIGQSRRTRVVLERWTVQLGEPPTDQPVDLNGFLPVVYKKSIVLFRSLYTYSKFLPAWKFAKQLTKLSLNHSALKVNCRIYSAADAAASQSSTDALKIPLFEAKGRVTEDFSFGATDSPGGAFSVTVSYRTNCEFRVDDSEALLSSHFMGADEHYFRPSLGGQDDLRLGHVPTAKEVGSLPSERRSITEQPDRGLAYGSLSTFHQVAPPTSSSPLSALRAARDLGPESPSSSPPLRLTPNPRSGQSSKSSLRSLDGPSAVARRPSVSFKPFKTPPLSASPSQASQAPPLSPRSSMGRVPAVSALTQARNRNSLEPQSPSSLRGVSIPQENVLAPSVSGSPRPASISRYSSSFGHRKGKSSAGGASKTEEDNNSSGRASQSSSHAQPGSGILTEGGAGGSSGSLQTDDDNISDFLKMLDMKKSLRSFETPSTPAGVDASTRRTSAALSRFQKMRDSNAALSDSMSTSLLLHRSSSSSSRQLSSVPPMVAGTSMSPSSSPGKPVSPHTPHTPAIPSRLSANSVAEYGEVHRSRNNRPRQVSREVRPSSRAATKADDTTRATGSNAIDIPTSPRPFSIHDRRSSSVVQEHRAAAIEDETGDLLPFGMRSASLGAHDRPPLSLSALLGLQDPVDVAASPSDDRDAAPTGRRGRDEHSEPMSRQTSSSSQAPSASRGVPSASLGVAYRPRLGRPSGRGSTPSQGSFSSLSGERGSGTGTPDRASGARYSFSSRPAPYEEDEPLLFAMSEIGGPYSRRSIEEGRGGSSTGPTERGGSDSASSSRRASRRAGPGPW